LLSKQTIGVVTLNSEQQRTIEDFLDDARRKTPEIESYFHTSENYDPVFVKNLESVQGDERDVILFSLGYGPTEPGSKSLSMNFGPLNKSGGERRLNVAITRATTEVVLFASFGSESIDLGRTSAQAVQDLKHYMEFAERGPRALAEQAIADHGVDHFDSDFEEAVAWSLRERGWRVQTQIGVGKFRIDLGIVNPDTDGSYLAGVECDGRTYHSSPSARDRDRTRQEVLESLGWNLIRLWSTDFFIDAKSAVDRIDAELSLLLEAWRHSATERGNDPDSALEQESATPVEIVKDLEAPSTLSEDQFEDATSNGADFSASQYFEKGHRIVLKELAQEILNDYECIDEKVLALEVANRHGLTRTSKKQLEHLRKILKPWAGLLKQNPDRRTYWSTPDKVTEISEWRGLDPFGEERPWTEIALPEALGLATLAIQEQPSDPVDYIFRTFGLQRRRENTKLIFESWVNQIKDASV
jgi:very-short-patch-repair endonuclease